jgi:membrane fusion protein (multidrug efflux system)
MVSKIMGVGFKFTVFVVLLGLLWTGCESKKGEIMKAKGSDVLLVEAFLVQATSVHENVEVPGSLLPAEETIIRPEVSGKIISLNVPEGSLVPKNFLLAKLFDQDLQAQLTKLEVQLMIAEKTVEREKELLEISGISQQDFDLSALTVDNLKADIESVNIAISKTEVRAPYEGQLGLRDVSLGSYISPVSIITTIREVKNLKLEFSVPERYAQNIAKGSLVNFTVDGGELTHKAVVIATEGNVSQTTRTLKIKASVTANHKELIPGLYAKVILKLGEDSDALMVPTQVVIPQARNKQVILFRNDSALFKVVETGIRDSSYIQITTGLRKGDTVITTGLMAIRPNSKIKITKVNRIE